MDLKKITVAGSGVLGAQIAFQTAFHGFDVVLYDISDEALSKVQKTFDGLKMAYQSDLGATQEEVDQAESRITTTTELAEAVKDADLVIESVPENADIKTDFYEKLGKVAPEKTVFATNSSTLVPSMFAEATGRPEKFLALHFANEIWKHNTAEIMGHKGTSQEPYDAVVAFAKAIGMVAIPLHKEQPRYVVNTLLVSLLDAALELWGKEVADIETIDKTWMLGTGAPMGPFAMIDVIGINTVYNINQVKANKSQAPVHKQIVEKLKEMVDEGKLGTGTGQGFYSYPDPAFQQKNFLT